MSMYVSTEKWFLTLILFAAVRKFDDKNDISDFIQKKLGSSSKGGPGMCYL